MLKALLNKGGAGKSLTRDETAERLSRLMRRHTTLLYAYDDAIRNAEHPEFAAGLEHLNHTSRADVGKLSELILSAGHPPPRGADTVEMGASDSENGRLLLELERAYKDELEKELGDRHMIRTVATLENTRKNVRERVDTIREMASKLRLKI